MDYTVKVRKNLRAIQGLNSPIRNAKKLPGLQPAQGYDIVLEIGVRFNESQLRDTGWFVDTDSLEEKLTEICETLSSHKWTEQFDFRPTFELVARWVFQLLAPEIPQLSYVSFDNRTINTVTSYGKEK